MYTVHGACGGAYTPHDTTHTQTHTHTQQRLTEQTHRLTIPFRLVSSPGYQDTRYPQILRSSDLSPCHLQLATLQLCVSGSSLAASGSPAIGHAARTRRRADKATEGASTPLYPRTSICCRPTYLRACLPASQLRMDKHEQASDTDSNTRERIACTPPLQALRSLSAVAA
jgi:hypothetical protein